jgi:hypothetical protein
MSVTLINDLKGLNKLIATIRTSGARFDANLHQAAYNAIAHTANTGDIRPMVKLWEALTPANQRALAVYATTFGKFRYSAKQGWGFAKSGETDLVGAANVSPLAYSKPKADKATHAFDLKAEIDKLIKRATKNGVNGPAVNLLTNAMAKA